MRCGVSRRGVGGDELQHRLHARAKQHLLRCRLQRRRRHLHHLPRRRNATRYINVRGCRYVVADAGMDPLPARQRVLPAVPHDVDWHDDAGAGLTVTQGASPYEQLRRVRNLLTRACAWMRFRRDAARDLPPGRAEPRRCPPLLGNAAPPSGCPDAPRRPDDGEQVARTPHASHHRRDLKPPRIPTQGPSDRWATVNKSSPIPVS